MDDELNSSLGGQIIFALEFVGLNCGLKDCLSQSLSMFVCSHSDDCLLANSGVCHFNL